MARQRIPVSRRTKTRLIGAALGVAAVLGGAQLGINELAKRQPPELKNLVALCEERDRLVYQQRIDLGKYDAATRRWLTEAEREGRMHHPEIRALAAERDSLHTVLNGRNADISRLMQDVQNAREEYARKVRSEQH